MADTNHTIMEQQKKELLELAEQLHDRLANELVNTTVNSVFI